MTNLILRIKDCKNNEKTMNKDKETKNYLEIPTKRQDNKIICVSCKEAFPLNKIKKHLAKNQKCQEKYDTAMLEEIDLQCKKNLVQGKQISDQKRKQQLMVS